MRRFIISLILVSLSGCGPQQQTVELRFVATIDGEPAACGDAPHAMSDLRFYVSGVHLAFDATDSSPKGITEARMLALPPWQTKDVALIDLENGDGACRNGTVETNDTLVVTVPEGEYSGLAFWVGVPFDLNHLNPLTTEPPLSDSAMHWHWRSGYKFLRAGVASESGGGWIHLGSTGCKGTVGNITNCNSPNRPYFFLEEFDFETDRIAIDLGALLDIKQILEVSDRTDCSSGPAELACGPPFGALGLGEDGDWRTQRVFSVIQ